MKILLFILFSFTVMGQSLPYRIVIPKNVSTSKKSFIINIGRKDGVTNGSLATFTKDSISFLARATSVNEFHSMWTLVNNKLRYPFDTNEAITMYNNTNYLWEINEKTEEQSIAQEKRRRLNEFILKKVSFKLNYFYSLSQSITQVDIDEEESRNGLGLKILYEHPYTARFSLLAGGQYWRESISQRSGNLNSQKFIFHLGAEYSSASIKDLYYAKFISGLLLGFGTSSTQLPNETNSGTVMILPEFYVGLDFPVNEKWSFLVQTGLTSATTAEDLSSGQKQKTTQINFELTGGFKYYFE